LQVAVVQNPGLAKSSTTGFFWADAAATETSCTSRSVGVAASILRAASPS
jgi:hypothetical protein